MAEISSSLLPRLIVNWGYGTDADTSQYNNVSSDILSGGITIGWGRDQARSTAPPKTETLSCAVNNYNGTYNNIAGPLAGFVNRGPTVECYITRDSDITLDSLDVTLDDLNWTLDDPIDLLLFNGVIDKAPQVMEAVKRVNINAIGSLRLFNKKKITIPLMENTTVDAILHAICDAVDFPLGKRVFDEGDTTILYFWMHEEYPIGKLFTLLATEGAGSALFTDNQGRLHFQGRQYRQNSSRSTNVMWYLFDKLQATPPPSGAPIYHTVYPTLNQDPEEVYNKVTAEVNVRQLSTLGQKWSYGSSLVIGGLETITVYASLSVPVKNAVAPVETVDFLVEAGGSVTNVTLDYTSGSRIGISITAGPNGATVTGPSGQESDGIYLRAQSLDIASVVELTQTIDVQSSVNRYGESEYPISLWPEINFNQAQDIINGIARRYREPRDQLTLKIHNINSDTALFMISCLISDRLRVSIFHQGMDHDFFIENKQLQTLGNGLAMLVLGLEKVLDQEAFRFGIDSFGGNYFGE